MATNKPVKVASAPLTAFERSFGFPMLDRLSREFDTLFDRFGFEKSLFERTPAAMWTPTMEMVTKPNELLVKVDVPGMKKEEVTLEVAEDHLIIRGERKHEAEEKKEGYVRTERTYGTFYRAVPLPEGVNPDLAKATMHDGVLEITMPMAKVEEKKRTIEIAGPVTEPAATKAA